MRFALLLFVLLCIPALTPTSSEAREVYSGKDLLNNCTEDTEICDTFFAALLDSYVSIIAWTEKPSLFCLSGPSAFFWAGADMLARPDELDFSAESLILRALKNHFPCSFENQPIIENPEFLSGVDLVSLCKDANKCEAYLVGALGAHRTLLDWGILSAPYVCIPESIENTELLMTLLTYLSGNQDQLGFSAGGLTIIALSETYKC